METINNMISTMLLTVTKCLLRKFIKKGRNERLRDKGSE